MAFVQTIDREKFVEQYKLWENRKIKIEDALLNLGIKSRRTWYDIKKELKFKGVI